MSFVRLTFLAGAAMAIAIVTQMGIRWQLHDDARAANPPQGDSSAFAAFYGVAPSDEQLAALADGVVTEAELRAALERAADCLEAAGVQPVRVGHPQLERHLVLGVFVPDGADIASASAAVKTCEGRHSGLVAATYSAQHPGAPLGPNPGQVDSTP
jgi:hypothetical protein